MGVLGTSAMSRSPTSQAEAGEQGERGEGMMQGFLRDREDGSERLLLRDVL